MKTNLELARREWGETHLAGKSVFDWVEKYAPSLLDDVEELAAENERLRERVAQLVNEDMQRNGLTG